MAATIGPQTGGLVVARSDQLLQLQMVRGTTYGSPGPFVAAIYNWSPRTIVGWDQFARDSPLQVL